MGYDAHTHLDFPGVPDGAVERARAAGITGWCIAGADPANWARVVDTARATGGHFALGIHPWFAAACDPEPTLAGLDALATPDAYGEIGLDRGSDGYPDAQRAVARAQLALARERDRPVVLHCVHAHGELLDLLVSDGLPAAGGLLHAFTGAPELARRYQALGLCLSYGPSVRRSERALRSARETRPDRLLLETDAPEGAPEPAALIALADWLAPRCGLDPAGLLAATAANARALFPRDPESP
ncbi:MAG: TatD family hydrolase [Alphaproteobacteria bacterium]|nr:TatD family hydrolase [Alphaproteobacteria bacterium]